MAQNDVKPDKRILGVNYYRQDTVAEMLGLSKYYLRVRAWRKGVESSRIGYHAYYTEEQVQAIIHNKTIPERDTYWKKKKKAEE